MADQLATPADLASLLQRNLDASTANMLLELATAKVQRAAGGQRILDVTDTAVIDVPAGDCEPYLELPQLPVRSVATVKLNGTTLTVTTDYKVSGQKLWRRVGWSRLWDPSQVIVTYTHGYPAGSQWLQLAREATLSLAAMGYGNPTGATSEAIDDYRVTYAQADARMQLSEHAADAIAAAYGTGAYVTSSR